MKRTLRISFVLVLCISALALATLAPTCGGKSDSGGGGGGGGGGSDDDSGGDCDSTGESDCIHVAQVAISDCMNACFGLENCPGYQCISECNIAFYDSFANCEKSHNCPDSGHAGCVLGCWETYNGCINPDCASYDECAATRDSCAEACFTGK